jgi:hypothetical protein
VNTPVYSTLVDRCMKNCIAFFKMSMDRKKYLAKKFVKEHAMLSIFIAGSVSITSGCILLPQQGRIISMGSEMCEAYHLLNSTQTGKILIKKASLCTRGTPIFLARGTTVENEMVDHKGEMVLGMTRACFKSIFSQHTPTGIFIYSNKDLVGSRTEIIALTLAFEFENVIFAMHYPAMEYATDSPEAQRTLEKVALELGLTDKI